MPRLETLSEINRQAMLSFPCLEPDTTPWSPLRKPLSQAKISLVTSAGLHLRDDKPFIGDPKGGDSSYRVIPSTAKAADILQSHVSIGFDHTAIMRDLNVTLPIDRDGAWLVRTVHMVSGEQAGVPDVDWDSYWATLAFHTAPRRGI